MWPRWWTLVVHVLGDVTLAVVIGRRYFSDMVIGFLRNEAASLILQGLDVSAEPAEPGELSAVQEPMFEGA